MKTALELKLGQHLTITPQLQQAIRLLQLSSIELQQEIQEALEANPLLEEDDGNDDRSDDSTADASTGAGEAVAMDDGQPEPADLHMDHANEPERDEYTGDEGDWQQSYTDLPANTASRNDGDDGTFDIDTRNSRPETLLDHLEWQLNLTPFSLRDKEIALALIDGINEDGYLTITLEDVRAMVEQEVEDEVELDEVEAVLHQIQNFDPLGVGARDLAECLHIQLRTLPPELPYRELALALATPENLAALGSRDLNGLRRHLKADQEELQQAILLIQSLNPRPGAAINAPQADYVVPDIVVRKIKGVWRADLNNDAAPRVRINSVYERLLQSNNNKQDKKYLQEQLQQAKWFIKSLGSRNETLLKVARTIVDRQRAFFDHGPEAMKPLVLHDIAEAVEMHESTISRVTTNKYMLTPRGVLELKYFFSSHVGTADGGTCSATAIRSLIKKLVESEPPERPISDSKIAQILEQQGINVARRTVAKYRESMNIPPSSQRKALV